MASLVRLLAVLSLSLGGLALPAAPPAAAAGESPTPGQSTYVPRTPVRLLDTRETATPLGPDGQRTLQVAGVQGVPAGATAVVLSVTLLGPTADTTVEVTPTSARQGTTSVLVRARSSASNLVTTPVGPDGTVVLSNAAGSVHVVVDLAGHYAEGSGAVFRPTTPSRLLDTRETRAPLGAGQVRTLRVAGVAGVPAGATAVALNVTAVGATRSTDVRVYPSGPVPFASNSNPGPGRPTSVLAVSGVGPDGAVAVRNAAGTVHLVVDLQGWFVPSADDPSASTYHPLNPSRLLDTRRTGGPVGPAQTRDVLLAGVGAVPAQATGVAVAVTAVGATRSTDVRVYPAPSGDGLPPASNLNPGAGVDVTGSALVAVGRDGLVRLRNHEGSVHLLVDLVGWYGPTGRGHDVSWPQCRTAGSAETALPATGSFLVVGRNGGRPYTLNSCFDAQYAQADALPGEAAVYLNVDAPGPQQAEWRDDSGPMPCDGTAADSDCAYDYGWGAVEQALGGQPGSPSGAVPATRRGGRPFVWLDVEDGARWQSLRDNPNAVAVNRGVVNGMAARLRELGFRYGLYADRVGTTSNDWYNIMGRWELPQLQVWAFRAPTADPRPLCTPAESSPRGPLVMVQVQPAQSGESFDVDDLC